MGKLSCPREEAYQLLVPLGGSHPCLPDHPDRSNATELISPSLIAPARESTPAFEFKMLVSETVAEEILQSLRTSLEPDPHLDPALRLAYRVTSVYFDTPALDVFHRRRGFRRHKHRIRRYGEEQQIHYERKSKKKNQVWKFRTAVPLASVNSTEDHWSTRGAEVPSWFREELDASSFQAICQIGYERSAWVGHSESGPIRLTIDRQVVGGPVVDGWFARSGTGANLLNDDVIIEMKFLAAMPAIFKEVVERLRLEPSRVSKYRRCVSRLGLGLPVEGDWHASA